MRVLFTTPILEHPAAGGPQLRIENSIKALSRVQILGGKCWTNPALSGGRLYARNAKGTLVCYDAFHRSLIERMEQDGVISAPNHKGVREVLLPDHDR